PSSARASPVHLPSAFLHRRQFGAAPLAIPLGRIVERAALLTLERLDLLRVLSRRRRAHRGRLRAGLRPDLAADRALWPASRRRGAITGIPRAAPHRDTLSARPRVRH